jgi:dCTP deaminase
MHLLSNTRIKELLSSDDKDSLFIDPLLEENQIGGVTVDLRLSYDFSVSILSRKPFVEIGGSEKGVKRGISSYFQETRRELGDKFVLYPNQVVLGSTLEYLSLPPNVYADVLSRSSYTRLGIHINTMLQPGFRGCAPLELFNHGNNAIELIVGSRICQVRLFEVSENNEYLKEQTNRKYYGEIRLALSKAVDDTEISKLIKL